MSGLAIIDALMKLLAFDTSTETLHLGASNGQLSLTCALAGGPQSSAQLIPQATAMLNQLGLSLNQLDAIVMGRGPGSFTGLRTACAVAQGLAYGSGVKVLTIDTLWAVAEEARQEQAHAHVLAVLDARMGQVYSAAWTYRQGRWHQAANNALFDPEQLQWPADWLASPQVLTLAGIGLHDLLPQLKIPQGTIRAEATPTAGALMRLAPQAWADGLAVSPELAMPLYVRDKVAQTTAERIARADP